MNREEAPVIPDPNPPAQDPAGGPVQEPEPAEPVEFSPEYDGYDEADAESFPASDPPAASEPGPP